MLKLDVQRPEPLGSLLEFFGARPYPRLEFVVGAPQRLLHAAALGYVVQVDGQTRVGRIGMHLEPAPLRPVKCLEYPRCAVAQRLQPGAAFDAERLKNLEQLPT